MTLHVRVTPSEDHDNLLQRIQEYLLKHHNIGHATIQTEYQLCIVKEKILISVN